MSKLSLYRFALSGHSHRAELMLSLLGLQYTLIDVDLRSAAHKTPTFLALNPLGQVPVLDDDGQIIPDSNAILVYLARQYGGPSWLPEDALGAANVQKYLSLAAGPLLAGPASARLITLFGASMDAASTIARSHAVLRVLEQALVGGSFLTSHQPTIADVACYTYVKLAPEGNVSLDDYPGLRDWLARVEALPGFVAMPESAVGLRAN